MGKTMTILGWGINGKAGVDDELDNFDGKLRLGTNVVTGVKKGALEYKFNAPENKALKNEGLAHSGDSGGPAFIDGKLAGVTSGGLCCDYGDVSEYTRLQVHLSYLS